MVADVHHTSLYGGVFLYPVGKEEPGWKAPFGFAVSCMKFSPCHSLWSRLEVSPSQAKNRKAPS